MGVGGAALATGISQCIGGVLPLLYFLRPNSSLLRLTKARPEGRVLLKACANGSSELMTNISGSLVSMLYNVRLLKFAGENGVAAYGVLMYIQFIFIAIFIGYTIGMAPVVGYHYGAENTGELKSLLRKSLLLMGIAGVLMMLVAQILALPLAAVFVGYDAELLEMTRHAFAIFAFSFVLAGFNIFASAFFTALNNGLVSAAISFLRTLVFQMLFGFDPAPAFRPGRDLVGHNGRRGVCLYDFAGLSCGEEENVSVYVEKTERRPRAVRPFPYHGEHRPYPSFFRACMARRRSPGR